MDVEKYKKWLRKGLEVVIALAALALAFGAGVLVYSRVPEVSFAKMPARLNIDVALSGDGTGTVNASDVRGFAVGGAGVVVTSDEKKADVLKLSGIGKELRIFNDAFDVVLHFDGGVGVSSGASSAPVGGAVAGAHDTSGQKIVASSRGKKYYFADCPEVKQIKPENLVSFGSEAEAKAVGYEESSCISKIKQRN